MGRKTTRDDAGVSADVVGAALDRLHASPLDAFVSLRRELALELRKAGEAAASRLVATAPKPSRTAWALNQVARRRPEILAAVLEARAIAVSAQKDRDAAHVRATARAYRERVGAAVQAASEILRETGSSLTATQGRRIGATVQALAGADDAHERARLLAGRLVADVDVDDPFAGLEVGPAREGRAHAPPRAEGPPPPRDELAPRRAARAAAEAAARERIAQREREKRAQELERGRERVRSLEREASEARASARDAEVAATRAQAEAERARRTADAVEHRLDEARRALRALPS